MKQIFCTWLLWIIKDIAYAESSVYVGTSFVKWSYFMWIVIYRLWYYHMQFIYCDYQFFNVDNYKSSLLLIFDLYSHNLQWQYSHYQTTYIIVKSKIPFWNPHNIAGNIIPTTGIECYCSYSFLFTKRNRVTARGKNQTGTQAFIKTELKGDRLQQISYLGWGYRILNIVKC